jgi:dihydrofolate reductase
MGRKTWEFDLRKRPLPERRNIVISSQSLQADGVEFARSLSQALECTDAKRFIIGGASIYRQALDLDVVDRMELTIVEGNYSGDVFFCEWRDRLPDFELVNVELHQGYRFETYRRIMDSP